MEWVQGGVGGREKGMCESSPRGGCTLIIQSALGQTTANRAVTICSTCHFDQRSGEFIRQVLLSVCLTSPGTYIYIL